MQVFFEPNFVIFSFCQSFFVKAILFLSKFPNLFLSKFPNLFLSKFPNLDIFVSFFGKKFVATIFTSPRLGSHPDLGLPRRRSGAARAHQSAIHAVLRTSLNYIIITYVLLCFFAMFCCCLVVALLLTTVCSVKSELLLWESPGRLTAGAASYNARQVVKEATDCKVLLHEP